MIFEELHIVKRKMNIKFSVANYASGHKAGLSL